MVQKDQINFGPIEALFKNSDISEIMINSWDKVFIEYQGSLVQTNIKFENVKAYNYFVQTIIDKYFGDTHQLTFDGILDSGYRYNITLPPLSPHGATLTIRKFSEKIFTLDDLINKKSISDKAAIFLKEAVKSKLSILVCGGTSSGKTSFLNTLSLYIPKNERVVSIEDTQELKPEQTNWIFLVTTNNKNEKYTVRECVKNSLRMRPDRIIVGECRGSEAYDFLQAVNTGHEGSLTTIHANSAVDGLSRLENLVTLGHSEIPLRYVRQQINNGIHLVIHLKRASNGQRHVAEILELTGMEHEIITRATIFNYNNETKELETTGYVPDCLKKLQSENTNIGVNFFDAPTKVNRAS